MLTRLYARTRPGVDKKLAGQAEGIAFSDWGDLYISNKGKDAPATVLTFAPRNR